MADKSLRYILDHWCQFERWTKNNVNDIVALKEYLGTLVIPEPGDPPFFIKGVATDYDDLLATFTTPIQFDFVYVENSQGTPWLPGTMLGTYYGSGLYYYTGAEWKQDKTDIHKALQDILDTIATIETPTTKTVAVNTNAALNDVLLVDASAGDITITLPAIASSLNGTVTVTKVDSTTNKVIITGDANIIGSSTIEISNTWDSVSTIANSTYWTLK